jgi:predicted DsbA family dithiol-disulfide isomerase
LTEPVRTLDVDFYFDFVCPWCWIGLRQMVQARDRLLASHPGTLVRIRWRSWPLLPMLPDEGVDYDSFYQRRFGNPQALAHRRVRIQEAGAGIVPPFAFDRIALMPNALAAHRLLDYVRINGSAAQQEGLLELLFHAFFSEGRDIGAPAVLLEIGRRVLGDCPGLAEWLADQDGRRSLLQSTLDNADQPAGVPAMVIDGLSPLSGVSSVDFLHSWLGQACSSFA